jgi:hypothetical protein
MSLYIKLLQDKLEEYEINMKKNEENLLGSLGILKKPILQKLTSENKYRNRFISQ